MTNHAIAIIVVAAGASTRFGKDKLGARIAGQSVLERAVAKLMSVPARRLLRSRRVTFLASPDRSSGNARLLRGTYQSPILVQWQPADERVRTLDIAIVGLS